jgi:hypothetical protein
MIHEVEPHLLEVFGQETDLPLLAAGTVPFFIVQHPRVMASVVARHCPHHRRRGDAALCAFIECLWTSA